MINFIYGTFGSGKTTAIIENIKRDTENKIHTFLIVPEQEVVQSERATLLALPHSAQLTLEVLSFSRLYNRVCREYGGLSYRYLTKPIRHLLMWQNMRELSPLLEEYSYLSEKDTSVSDVMLSTVAECKSCGITPSMLETAAKRLPEEDKLRARLMDIALIYGSFDNLVAQSYSDSADDISRLYDVLGKESFFKGANVYIDSFTSFTAAEHRVIERIFADAANVTVTVPLSYPDANDISAASIVRSHERLKSAALRHGGFNTVIQKGNRRAKHGTLAHIAENLWQLNLSEGNGRVLNDGSITMEICDTPYAEAEAAADHILELLRSGERCRDILVLMRSPDKYRGIIEPAFAKNGIPFYFSEKSDLNALPPVKLLFSALRIKQYNWQKNDVITHIKTGLYSFPLRSADLFEEYLQIWNISGARFTDGDGWTMNPDGYVKELSPRGKEILRAANEVRSYLLTALEKFFILLDAAENIPDMCRAVYTYFNDIELEERLSALALSEAERGNAKSASELSSIYGVILNSLADIAAAMPEESATTEEFLLILKTVFNNTEIGTIPTSVDEIMIGSAATARASNPKYTFVLGLCEGEFPQAVTDTGVFSSADRSALYDLDIELSADTDTRSSDELMFAQKTFATPSHGLYLFTSPAEFNGRARMPSMPWNRALALLSDYKPHTFSGCDLDYLVGAPRSASAHIRALEGTAEGEALKEALADHLPDTKRLCELPISANEDIKLSKDTVALAIGDTATFSSSRFEKYVNCPLAFYCSSVLKLREKVNSDFLSSDMGTFVHAILEEIIRFATTPNENGELPTDAEITERTEAAVLEYINGVSPVELRRSKRLAHIYDRLKRLALLMVRNILTEFSQSKFVPKYFELSIDDREGSPLPLEIALDDGSSVRFIGKIDRVDIYRDENDELYIRVVDYKTGTKVFSLDDVEHGINTQMLLYLFMLCKNPSKEFRDAIGVGDGKSPLPAGIMYLSADIPTLQATVRYDEQTAERLAADRLRRSGLVLSDPDVLSAMNREMSSKFLAGVRQKKDGTVVGDALTSAEEFEALYTQINDTVKALMNELKSGSAGARPLRYGKNDPCDFCKMKPICRKE